MKAKKEMALERAKRIANECKDAYSFDNYGEKGWRGCAMLLVEAGCTDAEVEAILRSKVTRWAADAMEKPYGQNGADALRAYFVGKDILAEVRKEIASWINGTERVAVPERLTRDELVAQRDELLAALKRMHETGIAWGLHECRNVSDRAAMEMAASAIAKAEGGAR